jgi:hypothetical protein
MIQLIHGFAFMVGAVAIHLVGGLAAILHLRRRVAARAGDSTLFAMGSRSSSSRRCYCRT